MEIARFSNLIRTLPGNRRAVFGRRGTRGLGGEANMIGKRVRLPSPCLLSGEYYAQNQKPLVQSFT